MNTLFLTMSMVAMLAMAQVPPVTNDGYWMAVGNMTTARSDLGVSTVGQVIVLSGGCLGPQTCDNTCNCYCSAITNTVELFYPSNKSFASGAAMPRTRYRHSAETINGLLYVLGGRDLNDNLIVEVDVYNTNNNTWSTSNFKLTGWTTDFSTFVYNGLIWMVGGYSQNYTISPAVATFSPTSGFNYSAIPPMTDPRGDTCSVVYDNQIYVVGGFDPNSGVNYTVPVSTIEIYNFATQQWSYGPTTPAPGGDKACGVLNTRLHVFGGEGKEVTSACTYSAPEGNTEEFIFARNVWTEQPGMDTPRFRFAAEYFNRNGLQTLYIFGGQGPRNPATNSYPTLSSVEMFVDTYTSSASAIEMSLALVALICLF